MIKISKYPQGTVVSDTVVSDETRKSMCEDWWVYNRVWVSWNECVELKDLVLMLG